MKKNSLLLLIVAMLLLAAACANKPAGTAVNNAPREYNSTAVIAELTAKVQALDSLAYTITFPGQPPKRMAFRYSKDGKPAYTFRSEFEMDGQRRVSFFNLDGFDYDYFPGRETAYRSPTEAKMTEADYEKAKLVQIEYSRAKVMGESAAGGQDCYILHNGANEFCVSKETGLPLTVKGNKGMITYTNISTAVPDEEFTLPPSVKIEDRPRPTASPPANKAK